MDELEWIEILTSARALAISGQHILSFRFSSTARRYPHAKLRSRSFFKRNDKFSHLLCRNVKGHNAAVKCYHCHRHTTVITSSSQPSLSQDKWRKCSIALIFLFSFINFLSGSDSSSTGDRLLSGSIYNANLITRWPGKTSSPKDHQKTDTSEEKKGPRHQEMARENTRL
ncbi:hypothetical protein D5086_020882 [Populus alba]|uniref:Uncharacterized protein n=1 Tax=Populus alba TaxID=43335 RepID=A0ACC4BMX5_POPAL